MGTNPKLAAVQVVVDEAGGLHQRVGGRGSDEAKAASLQLLGHRRRLRGRRCQVVPARRRKRSLRGWRKAPEQGIEGLASLVEGARSGGVRDRGFDLSAVPDNAWIGEQAIDVAVAIRGDPLDGPVVEGTPESVALAQDR